MRASRLKMNILQSRNFTVNWKYMFRKSRPTLILPLGATLKDDTNDIKLPRKRQTKSHLFAKLKELQPTA